MARPRIWDRKSIRRAHRRWRREVGETASAADWEAGPRAHPHWLRHRGEFPTRQTVERHYGSWLASVKDARLKPRLGGRPGQRSPEERAQLDRERIEARRAALGRELEELEAAA